MGPAPVLFGASVDYGPIVERLFVLPTSIFPTRTV